MKDPLKSGAIFRLKNTDALRRPTPPKRRRIGLTKSRASSSAVSRKAAAPLRVSSADPAFEKIVVQSRTPEKVRKVVRHAQGSSSPFSSRSSILKSAAAETRHVTGDMRGKEKEEEEESDGEDSDDGDESGDGGVNGRSGKTAAAKEEDEEEEMRERKVSVFSRSPKRPQKGAVVESKSSMMRRKRLEAGYDRAAARKKMAARKPKPPVIPSESESSESESEEEEADSPALQFSSSSGESEEEEERPAVRSAVTAPPRSSVPLKSSSDEEDDEDESALVAKKPVRKVAPKKVSPKKAALKKAALPARSRVALESSDEDVDDDELSPKVKKPVKKAAPKKATPKKVTPKKAPAKRKTPASAKRKREEVAVETPINTRPRRSRKPMGQWWLATPTSDSQSAAPPPAKRQRRVSSEVSKAPARAKSTEADGRRKSAPVAPKKPAGQVRVPDYMESDSDSAPEVLFEDDDVVVEQKEATNVKPPASPPRNLTPKKAKLLPMSASPHLDPVSPATMCRAVESLFKFDEGGSDDEVVGRSIGGSSGGGNHQPLQAPHSQYGLPTLPFPDAKSLGDATWHDMEDDE